MYKLILVTSIAVLLTACNIESKFFPKKPVSTGEKVWSFIEFHVPEKDGSIEDYYYFGLVSKDLYQKIKSHEVKEGLIFMEKVRYWTTENIIESYEDEIYSDEMAFRIEDIVKFEMVKKEPVIGFKYKDNENEEMTDSSVIDGNVIQ